MNRCMIRLYLGVFPDFPLMGFFWAFLPFLIEDTKSVEFASAAISSKLTTILV